MNPCSLLYSFIKSFIIFCSDHIHQLAYLECPGESLFGFFHLGLAVEICSMLVGSEDITNIDSTRHNIMIQVIRFHGKCPETLTPLIFHL